MWAKCLKDNRGQGVIEYLLLVALVAVASIGMLKVVQTGINSQLGNVVHALRGEGSKRIRPPAPRAELYRTQDMSEFSKHANNNDEKL